MCLFQFACMSLVSEVLRRLLIPYVIVPDHPGDRIGMPGSFISENERETVREKSREKEKRLGNLTSRSSSERAMLRRLERPKDRLPEER